MGSHLGHAVSARGICFRAGCFVLIKVRCKMPINAPTQPPIVMMKFVASKSLTVHLPLEKGWQERSGTVSEIKISDDEAMMIIHRVVVTTFPTE